MTKFGGYRNNWNEGWTVCLHKFYPLMTKQGEERCLYCGQWRRMPLLKRWVQRLLTW